MTDQTPQDDSSALAEDSGAIASEPQPDSSTVPPSEPIPTQEPVEDPNHQPEVKPEPISQHADVLMPEAAPSPSRSTPQPTKSSSAIPRHSTPSQTVNGTAETFTIPSKAASHGAPARRYLNEKVTGVLLEGMKKLVVQQPEDPLKVLGEYLLMRSKEIEGTT